MVLESHQLWWFSKLCHLFCHVFQALNLHVSRNLSIFIGTSRGWEFTSIANIYQMWIWQFQKRLEKHTIVPQWKDKNHMCDFMVISTSFFDIHPCLRWSSLWNIWRVEQFHSWSALGAGASQALPDTVSWSMLKQRFVLDNQLQEGAWCRAAALGFIGTGDWFKSDQIRRYRGFPAAKRKNKKTLANMDDIPPPEKQATTIAWGGGVFFWIHHSSATFGAF